VAGFTVPPDATQPGTAVTIDTLNARFVNASSQIGTQIWNTHSVGMSGVSRVKWYRINTSTNAIVQQGTVPNATATTHDYNASIAVNDVSTAFMVYSTSSSALKPQIRFSGKLTGEAAIPLGTVLITSPSSMTTNCGGDPCRWGDYSAVSVDPSATTKAWIVNQYSKTTNMFGWGTRIARIGS
jgi:hypothetical protein